MSKAKAVSKKAKAHICYKSADGTIVPGTTTITGLLNKPALIYWANNLGLEGVKVREYVDDKADIGTLAHEMIMCHLKGIEVDTRDYSQNQISQAENSVLSYLEWEKGNKIEPIILEEPLISEVYRYGGTVDCFCQLNGEKVLIDFKTGSGIYPEMLIQVRAYKSLLLEHGYKVDKCYILRIGRDEDESFESKLLPELNEEWEIFKHLLRIYELQRTIKGRGK